MDMETVIGAFEYFGGIAPTIVGQIFIELYPGPDPIKIF